MTPEQLEELWLYMGLTAKTAWNALPAEDRFDLGKALGILGSVRAVAVRVLEDLIERIPPGGATATEVQIGSIKLKLSQDAQGNAYNTWLSRIASLNNGLSSAADFPPSVDEWGIA